MKSFLILSLPILTLVLAGKPATVDQHELTRADAEALLRRAQTTHLISDNDLAPYRALGKRSLALFAPFLVDKALGPLADLAMEEIDSVETTRYMLQALPKLDEQTQSQMLRAANRAMTEYDLYKRAGTPKPKPGEPPPRFPRNQAPYPFRKEVHDAALAMLGRPNPGGQVFLAIGLSGNRRDIARLRPFVPNTERMSVGESRTDALAAMARLNDKWALGQIAAELAKPVPIVPAAPWFREDNGKPVQPPAGSVVVPEPIGQHLRAVMFAAGFSMNKSLIPDLIKHVGDAPGQFHGDYSDPWPAQCAADALAQIVEGRDYGGDPSHWKTWWLATR